MRSEQKLILSAVLAMALGSVGCVPEFLNKYRRGGAAGPAADIQQPSASTQGRRLPSQQYQDPSTTIYAVDQNTFRFPLGTQEVWDGALQVLLKNYNLTIVDRESGVITTEWDTFYLNDRVYRNKLSIRLKAAAWNVTDVTIYNNVEVLRDGAEAGASVGAVWLPADKGPKEVGRVVSNLAIALNQPAPRLPAEMMATAPAPAGAPQAR